MIDFEAFAHRAIDAARKTPGVDQAHVDDAASLDEVGEWDLMACEALNAIVDAGQPVPAELVPLAQEGLEQLRSLAPATLRAIAA